MHRKWIEVETLFHAGSWADFGVGLSRARKVIESVKEKKANDGSLPTSWCASRCESSNRRFLIIVESVVVAGAFCQRAFERLEPCAVKVASTVLRGERRSNTLLLPDFDGVLFTDKF